MGSYTYDSWGKVVAVTLAGSSSDPNGIMEKNPFRYRGYYYDGETGFYYLESRYYDPEAKRFINADGLISTGQGVMGYNMYSYCMNNPANMADPSGMCAGTAIGKWDCGSKYCSSSCKYIRPTSYSGAQGQVPSGTAPPSPSPRPTGGNAPQGQSPEPATRLSVVAIAEKRVGEHTGKDYCAKFVNEVFGQAGRPIPELTTSYSGTELKEVSPYSTIAWAPSFQSFTGQGGFVFHPGDSGYQPMIGDIAVYSGHVNIVVGIGNKSITTIGGSEGGGHVCRNTGLKNFGGVIGYVSYG